MAPMLARVPGLPFSLDPLIAEARRRARRRRWLALLALVVVAAAAAATLELWSASGSSLAAAGRPVTHIVIKDLPSTVYFNLKTGRKTVKTLGEEMWLERGQHGWHHVISTEGGRPAGDQVWRAQYSRPNTQAAAVDGFYAALATDFRAALKSGRVQLVGRGTFDGRHVDWLRAVPRQDQHWFVLRELGEVGVDAQTYKPILLRGHTGKHFFYERILLAEAIAYKAADFETRGPKGPSAVHGRPATGFAFGSTNGAGSHSTVVREQWLTAGTTVAGLKLRAVRPFTIRRSKHHFGYGAHNPRPIHGLALVYAPPSQRPAPAVPTRINLYGPEWEPRVSTRATTIYEVPRAPRVPPWSLVPAGSVNVQSGLTTFDNRVVHTLSIGYLEERGLFITIRTPLGQRAALQIARSLHTPRK
jgi:hypothetical protein